MFNLTTTFSPQGDQPAAINKLVAGVNSGRKHQVLLGVTGSGKTFTLANVIQRTGKPTLVLAPNKTLAAQLYSEFKLLFPENAVEYFVSYYDYYQPEAYIPATDTFIDKDASRNDLIDRLRLSATYSLLTRRDVIVVASVSCIYGIGKPAVYTALRREISVGNSIDKTDFARQLIEMQYQRNDIAFERGNFRVMGDTVEIFPAYEERNAVRISFWGDEIDSVEITDPLTGEVKHKIDTVIIYPATHYATTYSTVENAIANIKRDLEIRLEELKLNHQLLEAQRLAQRVNFDIEMMTETGFCSGIENYSRYLDGRKPGEPPFTLLDYFPEDWLMIIDESHISVPQIGGMFKGDRSRKTTLVNFGFRLPAALDNRPLKFEEFEQRVKQLIYVSATPADYEMEKAKLETGSENDAVIQQVVRPTGLIDPEIEIRPADSQVKNVIEEIKKRAKNNERTLITVMTKRMAEDLTDFMKNEEIRVRYLHSEIDTLERVEIIRDLRKGEFDALVGINLLREGLDIPEVSLVAIFDADRKGFLRSVRSLIQTMGRAARNVNGRVILYCREVTPAMKIAVDETTRRRKIQLEYNKRHGITPQTIIKSLDDVFTSIFEADYVDLENDPIEMMIRGTYKKKSAKVKQTPARKRG